MTHLTNQRIKRCDPSKLSGYLIAICITTWIDLMRIYGRFITLLNLNIQWSQHFLCVLIGLLTTTEKECIMRKGLKNTFHLHVQHFYEYKFHKLHIIEWMLGLFWFEFQNRTTFQSNFSGISSWPWPPDQPALNYAKMAQKILSVVPQCMYLVLSSSRHLDRQISSIPQKW